MEWSTIVAMVGLSYGTVGLVMWVITQVRLTRVERRVTAKIESGAVAIESRMNKAMDALDEKIDEVSELAPDAESFTANLDPDAIADRLYAKIQGEKGTQIKSLQEELMKFDGPIKELAEGIMDNVTPPKNGLDLALMRLMNLDVTPKFKKAQPHLAMLLENGKIMTAQGVELFRQLQGLRPQNAGEAIESASTGFGVRP